MVNKQSYEVIKRNTTEYDCYSAGDIGALVWNDFWKYGGLMINKQSYQVSKRNTAECDYYNVSKSVGESKLFSDTICHVSVLLVIGSLITP